MPDGTVIKNEDKDTDIFYRAPEILFKSEICGREYEGIDVKCYKSINNSHESVRKDL